MMFFFAEAGHLDGSQSKKLFKKPEEHFDSNIKLMVLNTHEVLTYNIVNTFGKSPLPILLIYDHILLSNVCIGIQ